MFEVLPACLILFVLFAARFSFNVLPSFFALALCGDLSDMMTLSLADVEIALPATGRGSRRGRPVDRVPGGRPRSSLAISLRYRTAR
jgi:hypothetical protein